VATREDNAPAEQAARPTIGQVIQRMAPEIQRALPKGMSGDRMARLALTVLRKTPQLAEATPESFAGSLLTAASLGLEPGVNGEAYLVPYRDKRRGVVECQLIVGYQGYAKLFWQHPAAQHLDAQAVFSKDEFDYAYGLQPFLKHKPSRDKNRGAITHYWAAASLTTGGQAFVVLTADEVKELRRGKVGSNGDIPDPQHWMERKTAIRQLVKILPKSTTFVQAIEADERTGSELYVERIREHEAGAANDRAVAALHAGNGDGDQGGGEAPAGVDTTTGEVRDPREPDQEFFDALNAGR
jgi:recombination protein RecT